MPGNHVNRTFGVGGNTTGHVVTWLTPHIHSHSSLVSHLRRLAHTSVRAELTLNRTLTRGWDVRVRVLGLTLTLTLALSPNPIPNPNPNPIPNPIPNQVRTAGWDVRDLEGLGMRCAELLEYGGGGSGTGLGWHWDVGSTLTLVAMLNTSTQVRRRPLISPLELAILGSRPHRARTRWSQ